MRKPSSFSPVAGFVVLVALSGSASVLRAQGAPQPAKVWAFEDLKWEHDKTAGMEHAVKCADGAECIFLLTSPGPFAILPIASK